MTSSQEEQLQDIPLMSINNSDPEKAGQSSSVSHDDVNITSTASALPPLTALLQSLKSFVLEDKLDLILTVILLILTGIISYVFKFKDIGLQAYLSFDIKDTSLSYDHKDSTIPGNTNIFITTMYVCICWAIRSLVILVVTYGATDTKNDRVYRVGCVVWGLAFLILGMVETNFFTNASKTMVGNLKPYFLQECHANLSMLPNGETWVNQNLTREICQNTEDLDYRRSFPSGHTTQAWFSTAYALLEVQFAPSALSIVAKRACQIPVLFYAILISAFRITGHHHHWYDVLAGLILGCFVGITAYLAKQYKLQTLRRKLDATTPPEVNINMELY